MIRLVKVDSGNVVECQGGDGEEDSPTRSLRRLHSPNNGGQLSVSADVEPSYFSP